MRLYGSKSDVTFLVVILAVSLGLNVYLARRVLRGPAPPDALVEPLPPGAALPPLETKTLAGEARQIDYSHAEVPSVLYFFSPDCSWCRRNLDNVKVLAAETRDRFRFIGISVKTEGLVAYVQENGLDFPVYSVSAEDGDDKAFWMAGVPQTVVVSRDSRVLNSWRGAFGAEIQEEIEELFGVKLPGLVEITEHHPPPLSSSIEQRAPQQHEAAGGQCATGG